MSYASLLVPILFLWAAAPLLRLAGLPRAAGVSAMCLSVIGFFTLDRSAPLWDSETYVRMASDGVFVGRLSPFCFRIVMPAIARASPFPLAITFEVVNQLSLWASAVLIYRLLSKRRLTEAGALAAPCFLILSSFTKFVIWYRFGVDQLAILGLIAVTVALVERRFVIASLLAAFFVLEKESVLLLAPFSFGSLRASPRLAGRRLHHIVATVALWALPVALLIAVRTFIRHEGPGIVETIVSWARARALSPKAYCEGLLALPKAFGAIPLIMCLMWRRTGAIFRREPYLPLTIGTFVLAGVFGASDYERVYFLCLPFVLMVFLPMIAELGLSWWQAAILALAQVSLLDVFARPDFLELPRWFMVNTRWKDLNEYAFKVAFWVIALRFAGFGRPRSPDQGFPLARAR